MVFTSVRRRRNLTSVGNFCEAAPRSLLCAANRLKELPEGRLVFPFNLIGNSTIDFFEQANHGA